MLKDISRRIFYFIHGLYKFFISGPFLLVTFLGNGLVFLIAYIFYSLEQGINPQINQFMDALWWSFATITTVGYGDITPTTQNGRILGITSMLLGTGIFATYTALFAQAIVGQGRWLLRRIQKQEISNYELLVQLQDRLDRIQKCLDENDKGQ